MDQKKKKRLYHFQILASEDGKKIITKGHVTLSSRLADAGSI